MPNRNRRQGDSDKERTLVTANQEKLTSGQAGRILDVSTETIRAWATAGVLPAMETPLGRLFDRADVEALRIQREAQRNARRAQQAERL